MTCNEFERVLPELEGDRNPEQQQHLRSCTACKDLVRELDAISQQAKFLAADYEPSPRVWNSIEIALRQEGLIREPRPQAASVAAARGGWRVAWLVPTIAMLLILGILMYQRGTGQPGNTHNPVSKVTDQAPSRSRDEDQWLKMVAARAPAQRAGYESDLREVDAYIRDAESSVKSNPNDEIAQQYLVSAYEQRAMVYEIAMDPRLR